MKKILLVNTEYREYGGEDANIIDELNLLKKKYTVDFINFTNKKLTIFSVLSLFSGNNYESNKILIRKLKSFKPDIVYVHNTWFKANLGIFKILKKLKIPTIVKVHNYRFDCSRTFLIKNHLGDKIFCSNCAMKRSDYKFFNKYFKESFIKSFFLIVYSKRYFRILMNNKIQIACLNKFQKNYMINLGINKEKLNVLHNPLPLNSDKKNYKYDSNYVVYAGRVDSSKGVDILIDSWIKASINNVKLKIIGDGNLLVFLKEKYKNDNIEFLGNITNPEAMDLIKSSKAVITATLMYEGHPRLLAEASSMRVPSIFPNFGGMKEYFPINYPLSFEQYNYSDLIEKIKLIEDNSLLKEISQSVYNHVEKEYSSDYQSYKLEEVFNKLLI